MHVSKNVPHLGRVYYPVGATYQFDDLIQEVGDYFDDDIALKPGDVVFDVGANIGVFARHAAYRAGGGLRLYCFEPIPKLFAALKRNCRDGEHMANSDCRLFPLGLTAIGAPMQADFHHFTRMPCDTTQHIDEKRKEFDAFFAAKGAAAHANLKRLLPGALGCAAGALADAFLAGIPRGALRSWVFHRIVGWKRVRCALATLEDIARGEQISRIDLLKIDVEGAELDVLRGIGDHTWPKIRQIVLEGHDTRGRLDVIQQLVRERGFDCVRVEAQPLAQARALNNFVLRARRSAGACAASPAHAATPQARLARAMRMARRREPCEV